MKHLRIENGIVREILIAPILPPFHPDVAAQWVSVPETDPAQEGWRWDGTQAVDPRTLRTLAEAQTEKKAELKSACESALAAGYTCTNGVTMDSTIDAVQLFREGIRLEQELGNSTITIRDFNNTVHLDVPLSEAVQMARELALNIEAQLSKKWTLQGQVDAALTVAEVDAITW